MIRVAVESMNGDFDHLLLKAEAGADVIITRNWRPVARLVSQIENGSVGAEKPAVSPVDRLIELRKKTTLGGLTWDELKNEGRR